LILKEKPDQGILKKNRVEIFIQDAGVAR